MNLDLILNTEKFELLPTMKIHRKNGDGDFSIAYLVWGPFLFLAATTELVEAATFWRRVVKLMIDGDDDKMERLDRLVGNRSQMPDDEFERKARFILGLPMKDKEDSDE